MPTFDITNVDKKAAGMMDFRLVNVRLYRHHTVSGQKAPLKINANIESYCSVLQCESLL